MGVKARILQATLRDKKDDDIRDRVDEMLKYKTEAEIVREALRHYFFGGTVQVQPEPNKVDIQKHNITESLNIKDIKLEEKQVTEEELENNLGEFLESM